MTLAHALRRRRLHARPSYLRASWPEPLQIPEREDVPRRPCDRVCPPRPDREEVIGELRIRHERQSERRLVCPDSWRVDVEYEAADRDDPESAHVGRIRWDQLRRVPEELRGVQGGQPHLKGIGWFSVLPQIRQDRAPGKGGSAASPTNAFSKEPRLDPHAAATAWSIGLSSITRPGSPRPPPVRNAVSRSCNQPLLHAWHTPRNVTSRPGAVRSIRMPCSRSPTPYSTGPVNFSAPWIQRGITCSSVSFPT